MAKKQLMLLISLMLVLGAFLAACTGKEKEDEGAKEPDKKAEEPKKEEDKKEEPVVEGEAPLFPTTTTNTGTPIEDGELTFGLVASDPFEGTLSPVFYSGVYDADILAFFDEKLLELDGDYLITNNGAATYDISNENKTLTLKIKDGVKWHDGEPVKSTDLLYAYELLGHPDYLGDRYDFMIENVVGMPEYHAGETKEISGIEIISDQEIAFTFTEATPSLLSGFWDKAVPRHYVGDIMTGEVTVDDIESSDKIRVNPIGFGPYKVSKIVPGESVLFDRNDEYWRGKPALKSIVLKVVSPASVLESLKKGDIDYAEIPTDQYMNAKEIENIELLADVDYAYTYIGFRLGKYDEAKGENVTDPNAKMGNKLVRKAMAHAMDNKSVGEKLYHNLRFPATTVIIPVFESFHDKDNPGNPYDPEKAKQLLDEAGYIDVDGDGKRENDKGEKFVINFASMAGGEVAEPIAQFYIQNWADVGLDVQLLDGRLHEFKAFYDMLKADEEKIDIYQGAWGTGSDPDPSGIHGRTATFNYTRWTSDKNDELLAAGVSEKAFDTDFRIQTYKEWQQLIVDEVPLAPTVYRYALMGMNKRVVNYTMEPGSDIKLYQLGVSE